MTEKPRRAALPVPSYAPAEVQAAYRRVNAAADAFMAELDAAIRLRTAGDMAKRARQQAQRDLDSAAQWGRTAIDHAVSEHGDEHDRQGAAKHGHR